LATPTILLNLLLSFLLNAFSAFFLALSLVLLLQERAYARPEGWLAEVLLAPQSLVLVPPGEEELRMAERALRAVGEVLR
jgi:hypothetical protein